MSLTIDLPDPDPLRALLRGGFDAALAAADPLRIVPAHLPVPPTGNPAAFSAWIRAGTLAKSLTMNSMLERVVKRT